MKKVMLFILLLYPFGSFAQSGAFTGTIAPIPKSVQAKMKGRTWHQGCPIPLSQLAYLTLPYWGYDKQSHRGVLIVNRAFAQQTLTIFRQLYAKHFPIERMEPMYLFRGNDEAAMEANNTSSFNCRPVTGQKRRFSWHSYGRAIDINTRVNPYVKGDIVLPINGQSYLDRKQLHPGMIRHDTLVYRLFRQQGWRWGGDWAHYKDYQHFEKPIRGQAKHH